MTQTFTETLEYGNNGDPVPVAIEYDPQDLRLVSVRTNPDTSNDDVLPYIDSDSPEIDSLIELCRDDRAAREHPKE